MELTISAQHIKEYLLLCKSTCQGTQVRYYAWLLDTLEPMECHELTDDEKRYVQERIDFIRGALHKPDFPMSKNCFFNSMMLSLLSGGRIEYIEGFCNERIVFEHGWCRLDGRCFDPTALWNNWFDTGMEYYGKMFTGEAILKYSLDEMRTKPCIIEQFNEILSNEVSGNSPVIDKG